MIVKIHTNELGQPIGAPIKDWRPPIAPDNKILQGRYARLEPLDSDRHSEQLFSANQKDTENRIWTYMPYGPFSSLSDYQGWVKQVSALSDPWFYAIIDKHSGLALGVASYLRIHPTVGTIEVGHINFSPDLQGSVIATDAMFVMMQNVFRLGYRRYEWKCDALNEASRRAATRLGFRFEGIFRQATMYKHRNRDTAWFSIIDSEWPDIEIAHDQWLDSDNFDDGGMQKSSLSEQTIQHLEKKT
jgi:RimJ/RimL family protein N-acetyltransferase